MTNKEAIDILWQYDVNFEPHPAEEVMHAIDMAIEALESQERQELIVGSYLIEEPSCSEEPNRSDTIYRQDAIDTMMRLQREDEECYGASITECFDGDRAVEAINAVPSAQTEIITCGDCKHWTNNIRDSELRENYCNEKMHGFFYQCNGDDYCSYAERRTDG